MEFSYNGKNYFGYQIQPNKITIQEKLEIALSTMLRHEIKITGAGRTDTGVHAKKMFAHFDIEKNIPENLPDRLNSFIGEDIYVRRIFKVKNNIHARFDATFRTYQYFISTEKNPFSNDFSWQIIGKNLDIKKMNKACKILMEYSDFTSFAKHNSNNKTNLCKIFNAFWEENDAELKFTITADRFIRNMVRAIVGTLIEIGKGKYEVEYLHKIIEAKNRNSAATSAPPQGLFLTDVEYEF
jgi:tRNA pseudouridine38-40 synthase